MPASEDFHVTVAGTSVHGTLHRAAATRGDDGAPTVLLCDGLPGEDPGEFTAAVEQALLRSGLNVVRYESRLRAGGIEALPERRLDDATDDAAAVFRWIALQPGIDIDRLGVAGWSTGALIAADLAARTDRIAALGLIAPATRAETAALIGLNGAAADGGDEPPPFLKTIGDADPCRSAATHDRPTFVVHGTADAAVAVPRGRRYVDRIENADHHVIHLLVPRGDHAFADPEARAAVVEHLVHFFTTMPVPVPPMEG